jgi:molybdenum cofactor cytidylyltransferase
MPCAIAGVLLAGGAARRFGGGKLLHPLANGVPIGIAAWRHLLAALPDSVVVVRAGDDALIERFASEHAQVVVSEHAEKGMGHSLVSGIRATSDAGGWVVALADMPHVDPSTVSAVADALRNGARIALPLYRGERGHPVGFAASCKPDLLALSGDRGARTLLQRYAGEVLELELTDPGVLQDIDTRQDAERIAESASGR